MNLKEYSKILNDTFEKIEKETGHNFDTNIEILAISKYLNTPIMKAAYPDISLIHDSKNDKFVLQYKAEGYYKFYGVMGYEGFEFRNNVGNRSFMLETIKPVINEDIQLSALNIKNLLTKDSDFENFIRKVDIKDIDNLIPVSERYYADFLKVVKLIKEEAPFNREFLKIALKVANKSHQINRTIDNHMEDKIYDIIKDGIPEGSDGLSQLRRLLNLENLDSTNYDFEDTDEDRQIAFHYKFINEHLAKNTVTYLLVNDPKNFIKNAFDKIIFDNIKKPLAFTMKLIENDLTVEQLYKQHPVVDLVFNAALKQDQSLNDEPEKTLKHTITRDKDIYTEEKGVDYFLYIDHIVDMYEKSKVMQDHFKTGIFKNSYRVIDPELDSDVIRFTGTVGPAISYMFFAQIDNNDEGHHKKLNLDTYLLTKNLTTSQVEEAIKTVIDYCKKNEYILCLDYKSMQHGLNYDEVDIIGNTVDKAKTEICSVLLPSLSEKRRLSLISKIDMSYAEIVTNDNKISEMLESKMSEDEIIKSLQVNSKKIKLKM